MTDPIDRSLTARTIVLADEILGFLQDVGPKPRAEVTDAMTDDQIMEAGSDEISTWVDRVHHTYFARFRDRVAAVTHELAAEGLNDPALMESIDPPVQTAENLQLIAEKLRLLAYRLPQPRS